MGANYEPADTIIDTKAPSVFISKSHVGELLNKHFT
jgi:hypothetical protein